MQRGSRLMDEVRAAIRTRHYSIRSEQSYLDWIKRFILFHRKRHPREMGEGEGEAEVGAFLSYLAVQREVAALPQALSGVHWLVACLQYGSGLRLLESVRLRTKDIDFAHRVILVRVGKGSKDRVVTLPDELVVPLKRHLGAVRTTHERDLQAGFGAVYLPHAMARKYPNIAQE